MSDALDPRSLVAGPGFPRMALGLAWFGSAVGTSVLAWYVGGLPGGFLLGTGLLGLVATGAVVSNRHPRATLSFSGLASIVVVAVGVLAAGLAAITGDVHAGKALAVGAIPVAGGLVTRRLSRRARRMAEE